MAQSYEKLKRTGGVILLGSDPEDQVVVVKGRAGTFKQQQECLDEYYCDIFKLISSKDWEDKITVNFVKVTGLDEEETAREAAMCL